MARVVARAGTGKSRANKYEKYQNFPPSLSGSTIISVQREIFRLNSRYVSLNHAFHRILPPLCSSARAGRFGQGERIVDLRPEKIWSGRT